MVKAIDATLRYDGFKTCGRHNTTSPDPTWARVRKLFRFADVPPRLRDTNSVNHWITPHLRRNQNLLWAWTAISLGAAAIVTAETMTTRWRWPIVGAATIAGFFGLLFLLLGPVARHLVGEQRPLTTRARKRLSIKERLDVLNSVRASLLQSVTGLAVVAGLIFTGFGLKYTARTLHTTQEGQITDRYAKSIDQLGSATADIRLVSCA